MKQINIIRIEVKSSSVGPFSRIVPDLQDTHVVGITSDGEEIEITCVSEVRWTVKSNGEPAIAEVTILGAEIDAVGRAKIVETAK